jgi:hypothetical protein
MMKHHPAKGIYAVAVVFFFFGMLSVGMLMPPIYVHLFGFTEKDALLRQAGFEWVLFGGVAASWLVLYGVYALTRLHPAPQWALFAMALLMLFQSVTERADDSPFYSREQIIFNRVLLLLPLILSCVYVLRPRFRATCRELRAPKA